MFKNKVDTVNRFVGKSALERNGDLFFKRIKVKKKLLESVENEQKTSWIKQLMRMYK